MTALATRELQALECNFYSHVPLPLGGLVTLDASYRLVRAGEDKVGLRMIETTCRSPAVLGMAVQAASTERTRVGIAVAICAFSLQAEKRPLRVCDT